MDVTKVTLLDVENNKIYDIILSKDDAQKASTDVTFATALLNAARKEQDADNSAKKENNMQDLIANETESEDEIHVLNVSLHKEHIEGKETNDEENAESVYRWSNICVQLLLKTYHDLRDKFQDGKMSHKKCWELVANQRNAEGHKLTGPQCSSKLRSLKKTYKAIKDHNSKSGNERRTWQYLEVMDEIFMKSAWTEPVAVASSSGMSLKRGEKRETDTDSDVETNFKRKEGMDYLF